MPQVVIEWKSDQTSLNGALSGAQSKFAQAGANIGGSLGGVQSALKGIGQALIAAGVVTWLNQAIDKAKAAEVTTARLRQTVLAVGQSYDEWKPAIDASVRSLSNLSGYSKGDAKKALIDLTQMTGDVSKGMELMSTAADLARGKEMDLSTASKLIGKVYSGNTAILKRYGIVVRQGASATEAIAAIQARFKGQAEAFGKTAEGATLRFENSLSSLQTTVGTAFLPTISALMEGLNGLMQEFDALPDGQKNLLIQTVALGGAFVLVLPTLMNLVKGMMALAGADSLVTLAESPMIAVLGMDITAKQGALFATTELTAAQGLLAAGWLAAAAAGGYFIGSMIANNAVVKAQGERMAAAGNASADFATNYGKAMAQADQSGDVWGKLTAPIQAFAAALGTAAGSGGPVAEFSDKVKELQPALYAAREEALKTGDWSKYDAELERLKRANEDAAGVTNEMRAANEDAAAAAERATWANRDMRDSLLEEMDAAFKARSALQSKMDLEMSAGDAEAQAVLAQLRVKEAKKALDEAEKKAHGKNTDDVKRANAELELAQNAAARAAEKAREEELKSAIAFGKDIDKAVNDLVAYYSKVGKVTDALRLAAQYGGYTGYLGATNQNKGGKKKKAHGGMNLGGAEDITWGEDGPEVIIPLSQKYRSSALPLASKTAAAVGLPVAQAVAPAGGGGIVIHVHNPSAGTSGGAIVQEMMAALTDVGEESALRGLVGA